MHARCAAAPQLYQLYGQVRVAVAPLISGAGVKGKVSGQE